MRMTEFFVRRPVLFWSLAVAILIAGVLAYVQMPKLEDPAVAVKQAMVVVPWPGAGTHEVELKVAEPVEDVLRTLPDVKKVTTECRDGMAQFAVEFEMTVPLAELEQHFDLLRRKVNDVRGRLPQGCYDPVVVDDMMDVYGIFYAFTGEGYTYPELYKYAKLIRRELLAVDGVKRVNIVGNRDEVVNIVLSREQVARNGLLPTQIMMALQDVAGPVNGGSMHSGSDRLRLVVGGEAADEDRLRGLVISTVDGRQVRLGDIATVERAYAAPQRNGFFVEGRPALAVCVAMEADAIVPDVGHRVDGRLAAVMQRVPVGMQVEKIFFQPDKVDEAVNSFMVNLAESVLIVILVLIFTMGFRSGVIIGFGLVLTIALSFPVLLLCGTTLQRISLGAFIVAMGMLVDNAIVIMDGILIDKKRGLGPETYLYRIGRNTAFPLLGATVIAAATFVCIYLSPGSVGEYAGDLFLVLCVSLLASWVFALVQVPVCAKAWLPEREPADGKGTERTEVLNSSVHRFVRRVIGVLIGHKKATISVAVAVLLLCMAGLTQVKNLFFPDFDYKQFVVECYMPPQTDPDSVREELLDMSRLLQRNPAVERVAASMGSAPARYCLVRPMTSGGDCYGELMVDCKDYATVLEQIPGIRDSLRRAFPGTYIRIRKYNFSISTSHTVEARFTGPDPAVLRDLSRQAEDIMRACPYVDPYSVGNNWKPRAQTLVAAYREEDARRAGVSRSDVGNALLAATDGMPVGVLHDQDRMVAVNLMVRENGGQRITDLDNIPVWSTLNVRASDMDVPRMLAGGMSPDEVQRDMFRSVPLRAVAGPLRLSWDENMVARVNGQRAIEAECDPDAGQYEATPAKVLSYIKEDVEAIPLPEGYRLQWVGEQELQGEAIGDLMKFLPVTLFIVFFILLLLFNAWKKVILILMCFPFVFCGITPALLALREPLTFMGIVGMMGLIGMMVKNAIVLVDEINRLQTEEHFHPYHAVVEATVSRVRPVLMASLTTIVGMIPLVGDPMFGSMAVTIMGGLTVGTVITLMLLPLFYTALYRIRKPVAEEDLK